MSTKKTARKRPASTAMFAAGNTALFADIRTRTIRGLLLPFGEASRRSVTGHQVMFRRGSVSLPPDPEVVTLNEDHSQFAAVGRAISLKETQRGIEATFKVARTPEGDDLLKRAANPNPSRRPRLSAEVADLVQKGRTATARLTGAAIVARGAFASAGLFELAPGEEEEEPLEEEVVEAVVEESVEEIAPEADPETVTDIAAAVVEKLEEEGAFARLRRRPATAPLGALGGGRRLAPARRREPASASALFSAIARRDFDALKRFSIPDNVAAFAIENIQHSGASTKTIGADTQALGYLGEIWQGNPYQRRFWPLFAQNPLTSYKAKGWKWDPANAPEVAAYAGNAGEVNSNAIDTIPVEVDTVRVAGGNRIDRRYLDFNDQEVIASYFSKLAEHYAKVTDEAALTAAVTAAGTALDVSGKSYPYGQPVAIAAIVDGALQVISEGATPSYAIVSTELWRDIVLIGHDAVLGYLAAGFGLEEGSVDGFTIRPGNTGTGNVLVGAREALQVYEFAGAPIRVDAMAVHNGALDGALYGYYATLDTGLGLSIVDTTDYDAPTPPTTIILDSGEGA